MWNTDRMCSEQDCDRPRYCRGMCTAHYQRWRKSPDFQPYTPPVCSVDGCERTANGSGARGLCHRHYQRWLRHGDPTAGRDRWLGDAIGYAAAHRRVRVARGDAANHQCVDCGDHAREWSYNHDGGDRERIGTGRHDGHPYSLDPADYEPRCSACHIRFDQG